MTIGTSNRNDAVGNDAATVYPYGFKIFAATDLEVKVRDAAGVETTLSYPTQYSVSERRQQERRQRHADRCRRRLAERR
jgi:hypothetical protein